MALPIVGYEPETGERELSLSCVSLIDEQPPFDAINAGTAGKSTVRREQDNSHIQTSCERKKPGNSYPALVLPSSEVLFFAPTTM
jgi:hypothetical protein